MKIPRLSDRIKIDLDGFSVIVAPLDGHQYDEMNAMIYQGEDMKFYIKKSDQELFLIKNSVKGLVGLKDLKNQDYQLEFAEGVLSDVCARELHALLKRTYFTTANAQALAGKLGEVISPLDGKVISGVFTELISEGDEEAEKK